MGLGRSIYFRSKGIQDQFVNEGELPDFSILFYYNVMDSKWAPVNEAKHGSNPNLTVGSAGFNNKVYRSYHYANPAIPNVIANNAPSYAQSYLLRCVDSSTGWKSKCDVSYTANISANTRYEPLLQTAGAHGTSPTTLLGRGSVNAPALKNKGTQTNGPILDSTGKVTNKVQYYNSSSAGGHTHRVTNYVTEVLKTFSAVDRKIDVPGFNLYYSFASIKVHPIIKDPTLPGSKRVDTLPKDVLVFYFGASGLNSTYYADVDSNSRYPGSAAKSAQGLLAPLSMVNNDAGKANYNGIPGDAKYLNTIHQSNSSGFHDHIPFTSPTEYFSTKVANYSPVITSQAQEDPNFPISHSHIVGIYNVIDMKSKKLKPYITKSADAVLEDGIIIGFSIGRFSGYSGTDDGASVLPPNWFFCDGTNGTPDLRGWIPFANFENNYTGNVVSSSSTLTVGPFVVEEVDWQHTHISNAVVPTDGDPGYQDVGSHNANYTVTTTTTKHTHTSSSLTSYTADGVTKINVKPGSVYTYTPPCVDIAFIMYKETP